MKGEGKQEEEQEDDYYHAGRFIISVSISTITREPLEIKL
jgi:hypothetical protein